MLPLKRTSGFFLRCAIVYGVLVVPWPGLMDAYRAYFRAGGNMLFGSFGSSGSVSFEPLSTADHAKDTRIVLRNRRPPSASGDMDIKCIYFGYRPTVFVIALVVATPIPWTRRWRALLWCLFWIQVFVVFRVGLRLFDAFSDPNPLALYSLGDFWKRGLLGPLVNVFVNSPAMHYIAPAFIWLLATFRRGDFRTLLADSQVRNSVAKPSKKT